MVGCRFNSKASHSGCSSYASRSHFFTIGLILTCSTTLSSHVQASTDRPCGVIPNFQHCKIHPAGVHSLDCFKQKNNFKCVWKRGNITSKTTYLKIRQKKSSDTEYCRLYSSSTEEVERIKVFQNGAVTAEVYETGADSESTNCTKAVFSASADMLSRCGPPYNVSFQWHSGKLHVNVSWQAETVNVIKSYLVRYKAASSSSWNEVYNVQIRCATNAMCSRCPWSETYIVPSELTTRPDIERFEDNHFVEKKGSRLVFLTWKFPAKVIHDRYYVTVAKASGETWEQISTSQPEMRLILSYSAFNLSIRAVNNASQSPAVNKTIAQEEDVASTGDGRLNVTVHSNASFTVHWKDNLIRTYVCFSVEWREKGQKPVSMPFFQDEVNYRTLFPLPEPLEPYKRYTITLHTRPNKDTCNMKHINNSESTYGSTQFYFSEGTPVSAPTNVRSYNMTLKSAVLEWSSIPEEDVRGFLLGYTIHYTENPPRGTETNVTVHPMSNSCELGDLKSGTTYQVQISGFTQAGAGVPSTQYSFKTNDQGYFDVNLTSIITIFAILVTVLMFGPALIKRTKVLVWPSIPNPGDSNAMQKIGRTCELELLESINPLNVVEGDTNSLQLVDKEADISANTLALLQASEDEGDSPELTDWSEGSTEDAGGGLLADTFSDVQQTNLQSPFAISSGYTTMEMFNQAMP